MTISPETQARLLVMDGHHQEQLADVRNRVKQLTGGQETVPWDQDVILLSTLAQQLLTPTLFSSETEEDVA